LDNLWKNVTVDETFWKSIEYKVHRYRYIEHDILENRLDNYYSPARIYLYLSFRGVYDWS